MKIQYRLSLLFLLLALLPLIVVTYFHHSSMRNLGGEIGEEVRQRLTTAEREALQKSVQDYGRLLQRDKQAMEMAARIQAREAEQLLTEPPPAKPGLRFPEDFGRKGSRPPGMSLPYKHMRLAGERKDRGLPWVSYRHPALFLPQGAVADKIGADLARLSGLLDTYRFVYRAHADLVYWQKTALESGATSIYPGHGNVPRDYDPRGQPWYRRCRRTGETVWVFSRQSGEDDLQAVAAPVHGPDGSFAGVSAVFVSFAESFRDVRLPYSLASAQEAEALLVRYEPGSGGMQGRLKILVRAAGREFEGGVPWRPGAAGRYVQPSETEGFGGLLVDAAAGRPGVKRLSRNGRELIYAYGGHQPGEPFPLVILPYGQIVAQAESIQALVRDRTSDWLAFTGSILLGAILASVLLAYFVSGSVVQPVHRLVNAAKRVSDGDYSARVHIQSGDELQDLGDAFNAMCPKLQDHEQMRRALSIAREAQQYLLPDRAPKMQHYDISGRSVYSGETGGDYYDFIELPRSGGESLGVAVGDISGHGLGAALLMASARGVIRSHAGSHSDDLSRLFGLLNAHMVKDSDEARFLTLFYGVIDPRTHQLLWASAGHDPALWYRAATGEIRELPNTGMPLGISTAASFGQAGPIRMEEGDVVLIGTDGIRETRNPAREMFGRKRLRRILSWSAHLTSRELCEEIVASLERYRQGTRQEDDVTMVVIKRQTKP